MFTNPMETKNGELKMKNSIIDKIDKVIKDNESNAIETLNKIKALIANERKPDFTKIKDGERFTYKGIDFIRLGKEQGGILCVTAKIWETLSFDKRGYNDFRIASIREALNYKFRSLLDDDDLLAYEMDLTADNGDKAYGKSNVYAGLLSADLYRKYRDYIPKYDKWVWLCTPWYCSDDEGDVRIVDTDGTLAGYGADSANGVVPAVIFIDN